jgi:hypothetical protein
MALEDLLLPLQFQLLKAQLTKTLHSVLKLSYLASLGFPDRGGLSISKFRTCTQKLPCSPRPPMLVTGMSHTQLVKVRTSDKRQYMQLGRLLS